MKNLILVLILVGAIGGGVFYYLKMSPKKDSADLTPEQRRALITKKDQATLKEITERPAREIYGALLRQASQRDPQARTLALENVGHQDPLVRRGVARALGFFDDALSTKKLIDLAEDADEKVRSDALKGLAQMNSKARLAILIDFAKEERFSRMERVEIYAGILKNGSQKQKDAAVSFLAKAINKNNPDDRTNVEAVKKLIAYAGRHKGATKLLKDIFMLQTIPAARPSIVRHLAVAKDPWVKQNVESIIFEDKDPAVRSVAVRSLHFFCPDDIWGKLEKVVQSDRNKLVVRAAIEEAADLPGENAVNFLKKYSGDQEIDPTQRQTAQEALQRVIASKRPNNCQT